MTSTQRSDGGEIMQKLTCDECGAKFNLGPLVMVPAGVIICRICVTLSILPANVSAPIASPKARPRRHKDAQGEKSCPRPERDTLNLYTEAEMEDVAVLDEVFGAFNTELASIFGP